MPASASARRLRSSRATTCARWQGQPGPQARKVQRVKGLRSPSSSTLDTPHSRGLAAASCEPARHREGWTRLPPLGAHEDPTRCLAGVDAQIAPHRGTAVLRSTGRTHHRNLPNPRQCPGTAFAPRYVGAEARLSRLQMCHPGAFGPHGAPRVPPRPRLAARGWRHDAHARSRSEAHGSQTPTGAHSQAQVETEVVTQTSDQDGLTTLPSLNHRATAELQTGAGTNRKTCTARPPRLAPTDTMGTPARLLQTPCHTKIDARDRP